MDRLLEATYRVEQRHFWWTGPRAFVGPLAAEATRGLTAARILDCGCGSSSMSRRFLSCAAIHSIFGAGFRVMRLTYSNAILFPLMLTVRTG